jgi:trehalose synthase
MGSLLEQYASVAGHEVIDQLQQLANPLRAINLLPINSTKQGGGAAEILHRLIPLKKELGIDAEWEIITGEKDFYLCTKKMHNSLQGNRDDIPDNLLSVYEKTNRENYERLREKLETADIVFIHDPQPAALLSHCNNRKGKWFWRCHIDVSHPYRPYGNIYGNLLKNMTQVSGHFRNLFNHSIIHNILYLPVLIAERKKQRTSKERNNGFT